MDFKGLTLTIFTFNFVLGVQGVLPSCQSYYNVGYRKSGSYAIDPDGPGSNAPFSVYCNFDVHPLHTVISHDRQVTAPIPKIDAKFGGVIDITYSHGSVSQVRQVVLLSESCGYHFRYGCLNSSLTGRVGWVGYNGTLHSNWLELSGFCDGMFAARCNCDRKNNTWQVDEGYIKLKSEFPITQLRIMDTGETAWNSNYTLRNLVCHGDASPCKTNLCGSGICLPGLNNFKCLCSKGDCNQTSTKEAGINFQGQPFTKFKGQGLPKMSKLQACSTTECAAFCLERLTRCRAFNFHAKSCTCILWDDSIYPRINSTAKKEDWSFFLFWF